MKGSSRVCDVIALNARSTAVPQIEAMMRNVRAVAESLKRALGPHEAFYALNRAWHELTNARNACVTDRANPVCEMCGLTESTADRVVMGQSRRVCGPCATFIDGKSSQRS